MDQVDVIVVGGGHAGCEAATAAARRGVTVRLVTADPATIGAMSCNPSIGGVGKGHLVRELDVFDGLMARAADAAAIHRRMLNLSKGPAVRGPRVQADRARFRAAVQAAVREQAGLEVVTGKAERLVIEGGRVSGIALADGTILRSRAVVLATGTFLGGRLHEGLVSRDGGRAGEGAATQLASQLRELALPVGRLKTGTPPRLDGRTIDWARVARQPSDRDGWAMSALPPARSLPQLACGVTRTTAATHAIIRNALDRSPLYAGLIEGSGPRYCPSIEDKVVRFGDRDGHQIFLEPEGLDDATVYPNGISTSLPMDVQVLLIASISGLEQARIVQPGYAVEYDYIDPRVLDASLAMRALPGLFLAGQINGTTGYEEASAQGLVAGLAAAASAVERPPVRFDRRTSYIGVMIDDLTLQGVTEPYRMLTARAEHRLSLRADNAVSRLGTAALDANCVGDDRRRNIEARLAARERHLASDIATVEQIDRTLAEEIAADRLYAPYVERQLNEDARAQVDAVVSLRGVADFRKVGGLSNEMVERLERARPKTLGEAGRIRGITPAALSALLVHARAAA